MSNRAVNEPDAAVEVPESPKRRRARVRDYGIVIGLLAMVIYLSISTETFLTTANLTNLLDQVAVIGLLAIGATICITAGVFDLTSATALAVSAIVGIQVTKVTDVPTGFAAAIGFGAVLGLLTGFIVERTRVHSFIATLALSFVYQGFAVVLTAGALAYPHADQALDFSWLIQTSPIFDWTWATIVFFIVVIISSVLVSATTFGRRIYAVGGNADAARLSGVRVGGVRMLAFSASGVCAALAGMILAARAGSAQPSMDPDAALVAIAAAIIGGTSILGGEGAVWRGVVGASFLTLIGNGFDLLGWSTDYLQIVTGSLILLAVTVDQILRRRGG